MTRAAFALVVVLGLVSAVAPAHAVAPAEPSPPAPVGTHAAQATMILFGFLRIGPAAPAAETAPAAPPPAPAPPAPRMEAPRRVGFLRVVADVVRAVVSVLSAAGAAGVALWSRIGRDALLENATRRRLLALVEATPGLHVQEAARRLAVDRKTVEYHARRLASASLVQRERDGPLARLFPVPRPAVDATSTRARLLDALRIDGPLHRQELAERLGVTPQAVSHHVASLQRDGLVESRAGRGGRMVVSARRPA